jgi:hypothetical protein
MDTLDEYLVGHTDRLIRFDGRTDNRALAAALAAQARRGIDIVSPDLEPAVYDHRPLVQALADLGRRSRYSSVRILVCDANRVIKAGHRLIETARRLSSSIHVHRPDDEHIDLHEGFMLVDRQAYLHKKIASRYEGEANFNAPLRARELGKWFDELWETSASELELRRLHI